MELPKIKVVLFTSKTLKDGTHPIMVRITHNRKHTYKSVGYSVHINAWDEDNHRVHDKKPLITKRQEGQLSEAKIVALKAAYKDAIILSNASAINNAIIDAVNSAETVKNKLKVNEESLDVKNFKATLSPKEHKSRNKSFIVYGKELRDRFKLRGSIGTYKNYNTILNKLEAYLGKKDLFFSDIDLKFLEEYQANLASFGNDINTIHNNLKTIKAIYHAAIREQIIPLDNNPFFIFKLKFDNNIQKAKLTIEEIVKLEELSLPEYSLEWHCRNFFLFSFYCAGIRASDALLMEWGNVTKDNRLEYSMQKTGKFKSLVLIPKALNILYYYKGKNDSSESFIFPFLKIDDKALDKTKFYNLVSSKTAIVNKYLKKIAELSGIEKPISTHIARHSFSDIARKKKTNIYDISKMLGHHSIKITEAYLASLDLESEDEAMNSVYSY